MRLTNFFLLIAILLATIYFAMSYQRIKDMEIVDKCIYTQIIYYGDLIGEDPDQSPRNIVAQTGRAIIWCLEDGEVENAIQRINKKGTNPTK